jgi:tetratricopeptide (TPR) repeat protein/GTPase SAR1 family protein
MTNQRTPFPYIPREKARAQVHSAISKAKRDNQSRAILLYGEGGVGKTFFVRKLAEGIQEANIVCLGPYDIDDAEYWLLPNLEREIATRLDPEGRYFGPYREYQSKLPLVERRRIGHETALAYLRQGGKVFFDCYQRFVSESNAKPVIIFDTLEAIRGLDFLPQLVRWMKQLKQTVFILASRPMPDQRGMDPLFTELNKTPELDHDQLQLERFTIAESNAYFEKSTVGAELSDKEKEIITDLCEGYPLWLAMTVHYLSGNQVPVEVKEWTRRVDYIEGTIRDDFLRRLTVTYRVSDFWSETIKRLGVVRRRVNQGVFQTLMSDRKLPDGIESWDEAWERLKGLPWIRTRANKRYVTLHDAVAEALAKRVIPLDDKDQSWRRELWKSAAKTYQDLVDKEKLSLIERKSDLEAALNAKQDSPTELIQQSIKLDIDTMEFYLLNATAFYYQMLSDYKAGGKRFQNLFDDAYENHHYRLIELLWLELQRFLPDEQTYDPLEDIIKPELNRFHTWYEEHPDYQYEIETRIARYRTYAGQPALAVKWLDSLSKTYSDDPMRLYNLFNLRANAKVRLPKQAQSAGKDFNRALKLTQRQDAPEELKQLQGQALNELGYYYRNIGEWRKAAEIYRKALEITTLEDSKTRTAIQSQYAYVQALRGRYQDAHDLVESALHVRRAIKFRLGEGMALSVKGEINRYQRHFRQAWQAYKDAEIIFAELDEPAWLGLICQEMAICLFQASRVEIFLPELKDRDEMLAKAQELALDSLTLCRDYSARAVPSALNRAGRIFGQTDFDQGLCYLEEGISAAKEVADNWFYFANLIEFAELSYRAFEDNRDKKYRQNIERYSKEIEQARRELRFPDLQGRWELIHGHLKVADALSAKDRRQQRKLFNEALIHYRDGYPLIAMGYQASHGAAALRDEMGKLRDSLLKLPEKEERNRWFTELDKAWRNLPLKEKKLAAPLNSMLTELYAEFHA